LKSKSDESLEARITDTDRKVAKKTGKSEVYHVFERLYNPLHLYCKLREIGIKKDVAKALCENYENYVYLPVVGHWHYAFHTRKKNGTNSTL